MFSKTDQHSAEQMARPVVVLELSLIDFSMQIPAVATTFAFIMGIANTEGSIWRTK
jgi:hypothetical protein